LLALGGATEQTAAEVEFSHTAPKGAINNAALAVCLKACPDTNREFFRKLEAVPFPERFIR
jgi:hypothetical protein